MALDQVTAAPLITARECPPPRTASAMPPVPWQPAFPSTSIGAGPVADDAVCVLEVDLGRRWIAVRGELDCATTGHLGAAMSLLALVNLAVQYLLALFQYRFVLLLAAVAALEPLLLLGAPNGLAPFAAIVLLAQAVAAAGMLELALRTRRLARGSEAPAPA